jgi:hypothetical protein
MAGGGLAQQGELEAAAAHAGGGNKQPFPLCLSLHFIYH